MNQSSNHLIVTGAGFTRAFIADAPLMVGDFDNDALEKKVQGMAYAARLLDDERRGHPQGFINIERLMTRLDDTMPYDITLRATDEYAYFLVELKRALTNRISRLRHNHQFDRKLSNFANHLVSSGSTCITFNYDDFLDEACLHAGLLGEEWNPFWGYGFHCPSSESVVSVTRESYPSYTSNLILKLHGSINWRARLGSVAPYPLGSILHHHDWDSKSQHNFTQSSIEQHLEPDPVIVPPVLAKVNLINQPVLRLVWTAAFHALSSARRVSFVGYSLPETDVAARTLFVQALRHLPRQSIEIVDLASCESKKDEIKERYRGTFGDIKDNQFYFDGALAWAERLAN